MEKINEGYCAELFRSETGKLLKLLKVGWGKEALLQEYENTKRANLLGIPSPQVYEFVELEGRYGFWMENVEGVTLLQQIQRKPLTAFDCAKNMARLHHQIHGARPESGMFPSQRAFYRSRIRSCGELTREAQTALIQEMEEISAPVEKTVCHGDFHPMNILLRNGESVIIDWSYTTLGDPRADVAGTYLITKLLAVNSAAHNGLERFLFRSFTPLFAEIYLREYCRISGMRRQEILKWLPIRAATYADLGLPETINGQLYRIAAKKR